MRTHLITWLALYPSLVLCSVACAGPSWPGGIHARLAHSPTGGLRTLEVPDGPAREAGLQAGDVVVEIDGAPVGALSAQEIAARLRGEVGSEVRLRVRRGGRELELRVARAPYGP